MIRPGTIVVADFPGVTGIKRRPTVVLSSDRYHVIRPDAILGVITSQAPSPSGDTDYALQDWVGAGLRVPSFFRAFLVTVPRSVISAEIGRLSDRDWQAIRSCVKVALADF